MSLERVNPNFLNKLLSDIHDVKVSMSSLNLLEQLRADTHHIEVLMTSSDLLRQLVDKIHEVKAQMTNLYHFTNMHNQIMRMFLHGFEKEDRDVIDFHTVF